VLDVIEQEGLLANATKTGTALRDGLRALAERHALIGDVRGAGLFVGVELVTDRARRTPATAQTAALVNALRARRVLISAAGPSANVLKIRPPLVFQTEHVGIVLDAFESALREVAP
jgi:4-aminobutyrate aminotransferase-like enzyme